MIPQKILKEIRSRALVNWFDDQVMQKYCIDKETEGYLNLEAIDFGDFLKIKRTLIRDAKTNFETWDLIYEYVRDEFSAFLELLTFEATGISQEIIAGWKRVAKLEFAGSYTDQVSSLNLRKRRELAHIAFLAEVDPMKKLLLELEEIIGSECYNSKNRNGVARGDFNAHDYTYRYPVTFIDEGSISTTNHISLPINSEDLIRGFYAFGVTRLNIFDALRKVVLHLKKNYNLEL